MLHPVDDTSFKVIKNEFIYTTTFGDDGYYTTTAVCKQSRTLDGEVWETGEKSVKVLDTNLAKSVAKAYQTLAAILQHYEFDLISENKNNE